MAPIATKAVARVLAAPAAHDIGIGSFLETAAMTKSISDERGSTPVRVENSEVRTTR